MRLAALLCALLAVLTTQAQESFRFDFRSDLFRIHDFDVQWTDEDEPVRIRALSEGGAVDQRIEGPYSFTLKPFTGDEFTAEITFTDGQARLAGVTEGSWLITYYVTETKADGTHKTISSKHKLFTFTKSAAGIRQYRIPLWQSIIPPLIAILMALLLKEVIISLIAGIWVGAFLMSGMDITRFFHSLFDIVDKYIIGAMNDTGHISVIVFSILIGGMVAIISRNGGMAGVVQRLSRFANSARNSQLITWILGLAIFFDDYANSLIVGNTMRPVSDRFRVSREKLAYIVDSTAAPVSAIALVTTWIGTELGYIGDQVKALGIDRSAYSIFLNSLQFAFYPILTIIFVFMIIRMKRDFGSMHRAELRARTTGKLYDTRNEPKDSRPVDDSLKSLDAVPGIKLHWQNAAFPVITVVAVTILGLLMTGGVMDSWVHGNGFFTNLSTIIGNSDSYVALLWGSFSGVAVALVMTLTTKTLTFRYSIESLMDGFKTMLPAVVILVLAWSIADVTKEMHTAQFLTDVFSGTVSPHWMPFITFVLAALISFSTGSSWGTMAILFPTLLPTAWALCGDAGLSHGASMSIMYNVTAVILGGSVFGDHCSPISDTTVLSSLATSCNHIDHVRTQLPYAMVVAVVSVLMGTILNQLGLPWWLLFPLGIAMLYGFLRYVGRKVEHGG